MRLQRELLRGRRFTASAVSATNSSVIILRLRTKGHLCLLVPDDTQQSYLLFVRFDRYNKVCATCFPDPKPVRTTVGSQLPGIMVEIDVIACVGDK